MKKTLFLAALMVALPAAYGETTGLTSITAGDITVAGDTFTQITSVDDFASLSEENDATFVKGNGRYSINATTDLSHAGTIVLASSKLNGAETATSAGQIFVDMWGKSGITIANDFILGETGYSEGTTYSTALRLHESRENNKIVLTGAVSLAQDSMIAVNHEYNYIEGAISGAGKTLTLTDGGGDAVLHLSGGATLGALSSSVAVTLDATKSNGETAAANKVYNIGTLTSTKSVTLGDGVELNLSSGASSVLSFVGTNTVNVGADAALTITAQAVGTQNFTGEGSVTMTLADKGADTVNAGGSLSKLSVLATTSVTGHDTTLTVNDFSGVLELTGRFANATTFGTATKLVLHGTRGGNNTTGFWGTSAKTFDLPVEIDGTEFVDMYASASYTFAQAVSGNKMRTLNGSDVTFNGTVNLQNFTDSNNNVFFNNDTTIAELVNTSGKTVTFAAGKTHVVDSVSGSGAVVFNAGLNVGNGKTMAFSGSGTTTASDFASLGSGAHVTMGDSAKLVVKDASSGKGVWIGSDADITISGDAQLKVEKAEGGTLTISADGANNAVVSRRDNSKTAKLGVSADSNKDFLKNVKVVNGVINYSGSDILYLGSMEGGSLTSTADVVFAGVNSSIGTLTVNGIAITLGSMTQGAADYHENYNLTLNNLIVGETAGSTINANLVIADNGTLDFRAGQTLTMGCEVTLGSGVTVLVSGDTYQALADHTEGVSLTLFEGVSDFSGPAAITVSDGTQSNVFFMNYEGGSLTIVPEPATATLSLLALAGLAARRRRH